MSVPLRRSLQFCLPFILPLALLSAPAEAQGPFAQVPGKVVLEPSDAQGNEVTGPGYYQVTVGAGSSSVLYALVGNLAKKVVNVSIAPVDAKSGVYGGVSYGLPQQKRKKVGAWIHLSTAQVRVHPGRAAVVSFSVTVPAHTPPGQYVGGLSAYVRTRKTAAIHGRQQRDGSILLQLRRIVAVVVTVPGPAFGRFAVLKVNAKQRPDAVYLIAHIRNTGTTLLKGQGHLWLWKQGVRKAILSQPLSLDTTVPRTTVLYPIFWSRHPAPGTYDATVTVSWNGKGKATRKSMFSWKAAKR